jgi:hypothetical protein
MMCFVIYKKNLNFLKNVKLKYTRRNILSNFIKLYNSSGEFFSD